MVGDVTEHDVDEGSRADDAIVGAAASRPSFRRHASDQRQGRIAGGYPLLEDVRKRPAFERSTWHVGVLVESRKRRLISAPNPQQAIRKDPLDIGQMSNDFRDAPLTWRVTGC